MDTRKIVDSFRNAQIQLPRKTKQATSGRGRKQQQTSTSSKKSRTSGTTNAVESSSSAPQIVSGPYIKLVEQKPSILSYASTSSSTNTMDYREYVVRSWAGDSAVTATSTAALADVPVTKTYKHLVPRDRPHSMRNPSIVAKCELCENQANSTPGLGDLFGPYRVSPDLDFDIANENDGKDTPGQDKNLIEVVLLYFL